MKHHQIDPALDNAPVAQGGNHLPPVRGNHPGTRTPSPVPLAVKRDHNGTPVTRSNGSIPSIGSLMNGAAAAAEQAKYSRSASNSPGSRRIDAGPQDIPHEKMGFGEDMRALRVLDRAFKT